MTSEITRPTASSLYASERDEGRSDGEAAAVVGHAFSRRGADLEILLERPRREYEATVAGRPSDGSRSGGRA
jgi:hypothetical protein